MSKDDQAPGPIHNEVLFKNKKFDATKENEKDFVIMTVPLFEKCQEVFQGGPKIVRPYAVEPETNNPVLIMNPVTLSIMVCGKVLKKVVDPSWKIGPIKRILCHSLELKEKNCSLTELASVGVLDEDMSVEELKKLYGTDLELKYGKNAKVKNRGKLVPSSRGIVTSIGLRNFRLSLNVVLRLDIVYDFLQNDAFVHQLSWIN